MKRREEEEEKDEEEKESGHRVQLEESVRGNNHTGASYPEAGDLCLRINEPEGVEREQV